MITWAHIRDRLKHIKALAGDPEAAHSEEDDLWFEVLKEIAEGYLEELGEARQLAQEAIKSRDIEFARWYA